MSRQSVYHLLLAACQVEVIRRALAAVGGNRTHAARLLGLQRTYLLRLMRDRGIDVPRSASEARGARCTPVAATTTPDFRIEIIGWEPLTPPSGDCREAPRASAPPSSLTERDRSLLGGSPSGSRSMNGSSRGSRSR
jgi:hypothetical protein